MDWQLEAEKRKDSIIKDLQELISIPSVLNDEAEEGAPFGKDVKRALDWFLDQGAVRGYKVKNVADVAGHIETGNGEELLGILGHVDVVPAGAGWTKDPFGGMVENGKLYGRGAIDDKGPTIAAWAALNMVKDAGFEFTKRVRLIIGTDEESGFRCVDRYFETEEMPTIGFAPDADFPIINAEKGIASVALTMSSWQSADALQSFAAGNRTNMVPDLAEAVVTGALTDWQPPFEAFLAQHGVAGAAEAIDDGVKLTVHGKSAHAMEPEDGVNAGILLALFLKERLAGDGGRFTAFLADHFYNDSRGRKLGLDFKDEVSGDTTLNAGVIRYEHGKKAAIEVSMRYSISFPFEERIGIDMPEGFELTVDSNSPPHHVDAADPFIKILQTAYEKQTGDKADLLAIGGGTYARVLDKGVAFGMLFPGEKDVAHQADEFVDIENLLKAVAIYAEAIYQLACKQ
ncbi:succinyl-diaminopimelate desuccinylase [Planomicrobium koreense]|uniref:Succinyl-diaminopimelate desuccinylase n=1 Tax=Planococcus koreensis TaxID=112331 RepID=A0A7W8FTZ3_9BACL|nr:dipeptidase PepV [Planococcus koreensis]MBB5180566.1 succinyl-diaminopimelate desuccinylase [Planococcus koreensis]